MDFQTIFDNLPLFFSGLKTTLVLVSLSLIGGISLGLPISMIAASRHRWINLWGKSYIYFFRGTPLLVQMFMIYHGAGQFEWLRESILWGIFKQAYWCALISFALNTAAYTAEIFRGAIVETSFGEIEAAKSCGMSPAMCMVRIILPSALRRALPAYGNEVIFMLHGSALAGVITIIDLFGAAKLVNAKYFIPFESFLSAGFFYLILTLVIVWGFKQAEKLFHAHLRPLSNSK